MKAKIVLISSGQPALNPRLVKEADSLANAGYQVTVIYAYWNAWGDELNKKILPQKKWRAICAGGHPVEKPIPYLTSRLLFKAVRFIACKFGLHSHLATIGIARSSFYLIGEAKKHKADIFIGHNLGAIAATVKAAKKCHAKCGFDAEDFHRREVTDDSSSVHFKIVKILEDKYFRQLDYLTASGPQISDAYNGLYPFISPVTLLNVFETPVGLRTRQLNNSGPIKIFWFSQTIGVNRGLEDVAQALTAVNGGVFELHLLGHIEEEQKAGFLKNVLLNFEKVFFYAPIPPEAIIQFASQFDIGLAAERSVPLNRDICLTNKLFTYLQAGLAIMASGTTAQTNFINQNPGVGLIYKQGSVKSIIEVLSAFHADRRLLYDSCATALKCGRQKYNWEKESVKFLSLVAHTLDNE